MSERYARLRDYRYPLQPDMRLAVRLEGESLQTEGGHVPPTTGTSWLLGVQLKATLLGRWREPSIEIQQDGRALGRQYFEPGVAGQRYLDMSGLTHWQNIRLYAHDCAVRIGPELLGWQAPALDDGPLLILAPHPDDAEIAAYGLYRTYHERTWIVTLSAGERLARLDRQYLPGLDADLGDATQRKGLLRAWNAATTPLLAGIPPERHVMLGHFNRYLAGMLKTPEKAFTHPQHASLRPVDFRRHNTLALPTDSDSCCQGNQLLAELHFLLEHIRPTTIILPDPALDTHRDHVATTRALVMALNTGAPPPRRFLTYANHVRGTTLFAYGPEGARTALPPARLATSHPPYRYFSHVLSTEAQKEKTVALLTMHDLQAPVSKDRYRQRRFAQWLWGRQWRDPSAQAYFRTAIKRNEAFGLVHDYRDFVFPSHEKRA